MNKYLTTIILSALFSVSAFAQNVKVVNPDASPAAVKIISGGLVNSADPHIIAVPGSTPSPSPAKAVAVQGAVPGTDIPVTVAQQTATTVVSTALEASHVLKNGAGKLVSLHVYNSGSAQFILIMNSTTVPADGAVTLLYPPIAIPATSNISLTFPVPLTASTGISVANSSTGTFTKTVGSANCVFTAQVQ